MAPEQREARREVDEHPDEDQHLSGGFVIDTNTTQVMEQSFKDRVLALLGLDRFIQHRARQFYVEELIYREEIDQAAHLINVHSLSLKQPEAKLFGDLCVKKFFQQHATEWQSELQHRHPKNLGTAIRFAPIPDHKHHNAPQDFDDLPVWLKRAVTAYLSHQDLKRITDLSNKLREQGLAAEAEILVQLAIDNI